tara:strand:+ start:4118 stop:5929 length:1812 start_codon:yes stop_codon:yes gene_type:complete
MTAYKKTMREALEEVSSYIEEVELDENKNLIKDYEKYMSQSGKTSSNAIDYLMSMPKYKRMTKDQMAKIIGDYRRKGVFKNEFELDEDAILDLEVKIEKLEKKKNRTPKEEQLLRKMKNKIHKIRNEEVELDEGIVGNLAKAAAKGVVRAVKKKSADVVKKVADKTGYTKGKEFVKKVGSGIDRVKKAAKTGEEVELDEKKILVADPKTQVVIKIDEKDWPKYEKKGYVQAEETELDEVKMSPKQIAALKKAYEPMRGGRISTDNATKLGKLMDKFDKDKDLLIQLFKADIPFVSNLAMTRLITKHNMKGAEINKLKEELGEQIVNKYLNTKQGSLEESVLEIWKEAAIEEDFRMDGRTKAYKEHRAKLESARKARLEKLTAKQKQLDIDGDGEIEASDLAKLRKGAKPKKEDLEDSPNAANSQHLCAKNVVHEEWGNGECIPTMHAEPDEEGNIGWYDVMFEHGLERGVAINELKVTRSEAHENHKKKNGKMLKAKYHEEEIDESYEMGTDEYRKHTQSVTPGQDITDFHNFKVESMKEALAKVWGKAGDELEEYITKDGMRRRVAEGDKRRTENKDTGKGGKTMTGKTSDVINLKPSTDSK